MVVAVAAALGMGCDREPEVQEPARTVRVAISTDFAVPEGIDTMTIRVERGGSEAFNDSYDESVLSSLPDSLLLENAQPLDDTGDPILTPVRVIVTASLNDEEQVRRSAEFVFQIDHPVLLRMPLCTSCVAQDCGADQTCKDGACADDGVDATALPIDDGTQPLEAECTAG